MARIVSAAGGTVTVGIDQVTGIALGQSVQATGYTFGEFAWSAGLNNSPMVVPVITGISPDTGPSNSDGVTGTGQLTLIGTAQANSTVTISRSGVGVIGTVTADLNGNWTFNYTGTTLANGSYTFSALETAFGPLGVAGGFNVFVFGNDSQSGTDTQGRVAAGGNATFSNYSEGSSLTNSHGTRDEFIAGGNLSFSSGTVANGNVVYGGTANLPQSLTISNGTGATPPS